MINEMSKSWQDNQGSQDHDLHCEVVCRLCLLVIVEVSDAVLVHDLHVFLGRS